MDRILDRVWLLRAMCHTPEQCTCADRGGMVDDYDACRIVSRHANAIIAKAKAEPGPDDGPLFGVRHGPL